LTKRKTLVVGASTNPARYANMAVHQLLKHEQPVEAIGLREDHIGPVAIQTGFPALTDIHTVTLYLNAQRQEAYYDYLLGLAPKRIIFNPGTENPEFAEKARKAGVETIEACTLVMLSTNQYS
jgi:hypothetical protein